MRPAIPLFSVGRYRFQYKLKAITPCATKEWSGHARLQLVLHGFLLSWDHYFRDFSIGCNNGKMITMTKTTVQLSAVWWRTLHFTAKYLYNNISIKLPHVWNSRFDRINKPLVPAKIRRNNFRGWGKIHENSEIIVLENFPLNGIAMRLSTVNMDGHS